MSRWDATSDEELMRQHQKGDEAAFGLLHSRYAVLVLSYLQKSLGDREGLELLKQEVFAVAIRNSIAYRFPQKFSTWLFTIAYRVVNERG